jgi:1,4-alpha-glucan branching enzyme
MPAPLGRLCLILHGHLPYVLHHGLWPHGEAWLFEAAAETYLPLLELLDTLSDAGAAAGARLTVGLTPVLLEQLADGHFKAGFVRHLHERIGRAAADAVEFERKRDGARAVQATRWQSWYEKRLGYFEQIRQDIPGAFAAHARAGRIEVLTSAATHAYLPLLLEDSSIRAQLSAGLAITRTHLDVAPRGCWLPECAYRPATTDWRPAVLGLPPRARTGLETHLAGAGLSHFFVDAHLLSQARPVATIGRDGQIEPMSEALVYWDTQRGWGNPMEPAAVAAAPQPPGVYSFARHPRISEQVWSGVIGYPGAAEYLEFHVKHGQGGLRYHRVTSHDVPAAEKAIYDPRLVPGKIYEHSHHFCQVVRQLLRQYTAETGRVGTIVAPFDAELFGHWWFEGPQFLHDVLLTLAHDGSVELVTPQQVLETNPPDKEVCPPEGSWGANGNHSVWLNEQTRWLWESEYHAEQRFGHLLKELPWQTKPAVRQHLEQAARELLLLQASDWPFVIHSGGAADYGAIRFAGHVTRFDRLGNIAQAVAAGEKIDAVQQTEIAEAAAHDAVFSAVDLNWWR